MKKSRRAFIKKSAIGTAGITIGGMGMTAKSYGSILGANDKIRVGILGFSNRFKGALGKAFLKYSGELNFLRCATSGTVAATKDRHGTTKQQAVKSIRPEIPTNCGNSSPAHRPACHIR